MYIPFNTPTSCPILYNKIANFVLMPTALVSSPAVPADPKQKNGSKQDMCLSTDSTNPHPIFPEETMSFCLRNLRVQFLPICFPSISTMKMKTVLWCINQQDYMSVEIIPKRFAGHSSITSPHQQKGLAYRSPNQHTDWTEEPVGLC